MKADGTRKRKSRKRIRQPREIQEKLELDPIFNDLLEEFEGLLEVLELVVEQRPHLTPLVAMRLCELSRDMRFRLCPAERVPPQRLKNVVGLFQKVKRVIGENAEHSEVAGYLENIEVRIDDLKTAIEG